MKLFSNIEPDVWVVAHKCEQEFRCAVFRTNDYSLGQTPTAHVLPSDMLLTATRFNVQMKL